MDALVIGSRKLMHRRYELRGLLLSSRCHWFYFCNYFYDYYYYYYYNFIELLTLGFYY